MTLDQLLAFYPQEVLLPVLIGMICGALFSAFLSVRFFKFTVTLSAVFSGFEIGYTVFTLIVGESVEGIPFDLGLLVGLAFAIVFGILALRVYKALIYACGGLYGAALGFAIPFLILGAFGYEIVGIIVGIVLAIVLAIVGAKLMFKCFKPLLIFFSSLYGMGLALACLAIIIFGGNEAAVGIAYFIGFIPAIFAMKVQARLNEDRELFD